MSDLVSYNRRGAIAVIEMDDGKVNVLSPTMLSELGAAFDQAHSDGAVVVVAGRPDMFSAGFDLNVLRGGGPEALGMLRSGFELAARTLEFPLPVVVACTGHCIAMGVFLLLSADFRVGGSGPYRIVANEVAIGLPMPGAAIEICRQRLTPAHFHRAVTLAETFSPEEALTAGFLDRVAPAPDVKEVALASAEMLALLDMTAHRITKERVNASLLPALRAAIETDDGELRALA
jgi:enoyl-CoA hydratase